MNVHILWYGVSLCGSGMPSAWPKGDRWVAFNDDALSVASCWKCRVALLNDLPQAALCWCAPGVGTYDVHGVATCDSCGKLMLASTLGAIVRSAANPSPALPVNRERGDDLDGTRREVPEGEPDPHVGPGSGHAEGHSAATEGGHDEDSERYDGHGRAVSLLRNLQRYDETWTSTEASLLLGLAEALPLLSDGERSELRVMFDRALGRPA